MEEIIKKLGEKIEEFVSKKEVVDKMDADLLKYQKIVLEKNEEAQQIKEKESGFYKDIINERDENQKLHRELFDQREKEKNKLNKEIAESKLEIIKELKEKQKVIDENRKKDLENIDVEALKKEKEVIEEELALNDVTKEEFLKMNSEEQSKVRRSKERYLINKKRLAEIEPVIDLADLLDGKEPKDRFLEISDVINQVNEKFNIEHMEELKSLVTNKEDKDKHELNENDKEDKDEQEQTKNDKDENKDEQEQNENYKEVKDEHELNENLNEDDNKDYTLNRNNKDVEDVYEKVTNIKNININEKDRVVIWTRTDGEEGKYSLDAIKSEKKAMFKRLDILSSCRDNSKNILSALALYMKVNPAIIKAMGNDKDAILNYLDCLNNKNEFPFELVHDLSGLNIFQKLTNRFVRVEEKLGAVIRGKIFNKNKALSEPKEDNKAEQIKTSSQAHRDFEKALKIVNQDRDDIKSANELKESLSKEVAEMMDSNKDEANKYSELVNKDYMQGLEEQFNDALNEKQNLEELKDEDYTR